VGKEDQLLNRHLAPRRSAQVAAACRCLQGRRSGERQRTCGEM